MYVTLEPCCHHGLTPPFTDMIIKSNISEVIYEVTDIDKIVRNKSFKKKGKDNLIRNYGIGAQIIKDLKIKKMILITRTPKKVIGLEGYNIKITKQELIWWKKF